MYARPTDCLAPGGQPNDAHNSPFHASKAQNTSLITLEPRSHSHWPPPPTRKEVCGPARGGSCRSHPALERCTQDAGITRQCPLPGGIPRHNRGWVIDTTLCRTS